MDHRLFIQHGDEQPAYGLRLRHVYVTCSSRNIWNMEMKELFMCRCVHICFIGERDVCLTESCLVVNNKLEQCVISNQLIHVIHSTAFLTYCFEHGRPADKLTAITDHCWHNTAHYHSYLFGHSGPEVAGFCIGVLMLPQIQTQSSHKCLTAKKGFQHANDWRTLQTRQIIWSIKIITC